MRARLMTLCFVLATVVSAISAAPAAIAQQEFPHCIAPDGLDLNNLYGISDQIVTVFCPVANSGRRWVTTSRWTIAEEYGSLPKGFVPAGATPLEDFIAKFLGENYVIDAGTQFEESIFLPNNGNLFTDVTSDHRFPIFVSPITLGSVHPLDIGTHTVSLYWSFSAMHCDGGHDIKVNCLTAGDHLFRQVTFEVVAGN